MTPHRRRRQIIRGYLKVFEAALPLYRYKEQKQLIGHVAGLAAQKWLQRGASQQDVADLYGISRQRLNALLALRPVQASALCGEFLIIDILQRARPETMTPGQLEREYWRRAEGLSDDPCAFLEARLRLTRLQVIEDTGGRIALTRFHPTVPSADGVTIYKEDPGGLGERIVDLCEQLTAGYDEPDTDKLAGRFTAAFPRDLSARRAAIKRLRDGLVALVEEIEREAEREGSPTQTVHGSYAFGSLAPQQGEER